MSAPARQLVLCLALATVLHALALSLVGLPAARRERARALLVRLDRVAEQTRLAELGTPAATREPAPPAAMPASEADPFDHEFDTRAAEPETSAAAAVRPARRASPETMARRADDERHARARPAARHAEPAVATAAAGQPATAAERTGAADPDPVAKASYESTLAAWFDRHKFYPFRLRRQGVEGEGVLRLRVDRAGRIELAEMQRRIGDSRLDDLTLAIVDRAEPFPGMPVELAGSSFECAIDVYFTLTK